MQLTKFTHACVRLDDGDRSLVIDPGTFSEVEQALDGARAVLITHEHADHIDADKVRAALQADSRLALFAPASVAHGLSAEFGDQIRAVKPSEQFDAGGFTVTTHGGQHALIHPMIPIIANVGYLVEGVYHPGDSFAVPAEPVSTLLLPTNAPWSKSSEVVDFAISVRAPRVHQIHDSMVTEVYKNIVEGQIHSIAGPHGVEFSHLKPTESVTA
jgi:L-ascorbate metabolism protein UlaG (beta-lactamase superfamily)